MSAPQAPDLSSLRLPHYKTGLQFLVERVTIIGYVYNLEGINQQISFSRPQAKACWLFTLELEHKKLINTCLMTVKLQADAMQLYEEGVEQVSYVDTLEWLVKSQRDEAHQTAKLSAELEPSGATLDNIGGTSKEQSSNQLGWHMARRTPQEEKYSNLQDTSAVLETMATVTYHMGYQQLEDQYSGPVPPQAMEEYKKTCMERAQEYLTSQVKFEVTRKQTAAEDTMDIDSILSRNEVLKDEELPIEDRDLSNVDLQRPFMDVDKPFDPTIECIERAALEVLRRQYIRSKQPKSPNLGSLKFRPVRKALQTKMEAQLERQVSHREVSSELLKITRKQLNYLATLKRKHKNDLRKVIVGPPKVKAATRKRRGKHDHKLRREAKLQRIHKTQSTLPSTGGDGGSLSAHSSLRDKAARTGSHSQFMLAETAIDMDTALVEDTDFLLPANKPPFESLRSKSEYAFRSNSKPRPIQVREEEGAVEGLSQMEYDVRMGIDRMALQG